MPKRNRAPLLHTAPPKRQCRDLEAPATTPADQRCLALELDSFPASNTTRHFCKRCEKLDLPTLLTGRSNPTRIGFLEEFDDPLCQLCDTIQHFVKLHWGHDTPSAVNGRRPSVHMKSKAWCTIYDSAWLEQVVYRIILALDQRPPNLQLMRQQMSYDKTADFVLTELEIDPMRVNYTRIPISSRRTIPAYFDPGLVQNWLDDCRDHYHCGRDNRAPPWADTKQTLYTRGLRLIDVLEGRLVEQTNPCEYVALSYVWGQAASFGLCTNKDNLSILCQPSALDKIQSDPTALRRLPKTIADAISLCRSIGKKYLWVDSLCIVQDDPDEKRRLIHGMNSIYENAYLTLIALSGVDADAGLAGISPRAPDVDNCGRAHLFHEVHGTSSIGVGRISLIEQIRCSRWNTRGWTYQEQLLSPRKLYFAPGEVFYECKCQQRREGYVFEESIRRSYVRSGAPSYGQYLNADPTEFSQPVRTLGASSCPEAEGAFSAQWADEDFQEIVSVYTRRHLKEPGDILYALTGVYNWFYPSPVMQNVDINELQGIPGRCISRALLWFTTEACRAKRSDVSGATPSTWSWSSLVTPIDFACSKRSVFPASVEDLAHYSLDAVSLVEEWWLTFQAGDTVAEERFPGQIWYEGDDDLRSIMDAVPRKEDGVPSRLSPPSMPGLLDFRAIYIPVPVMATSPRWSQETAREWHLRFGDEILNITAIALLDCDETTLDGFVLLLYDPNFIGICVRSKGEYFERVGICMLTDHCNWKVVMQRGLLEVYWRRILLR